jgi:hypothetical protein
LPGIVLYSSAFHSDGHLYAQWQTGDFRKRCHLHAGTERYIRNAPPPTIVVFFLANIQRCTPMGRFKSERQQMESHAGSREK